MKRISLLRYVSFTVFAGVTISRSGAQTLYVPGGSVASSSTGQVLLSGSYNTGFFVGDPNWGFTVSNSGSNYYTNVVFGGTGDNSRGIQLMDGYGGKGTILFVGGSGNVGIGTTTPTTALEVRGTVSVDSSTNGSVMAQLGKSSTDSGF